MILPHLEQQNLYKQLDFSHHATHANNQPAISQGRRHVCLSFDAAQHTDGARAVVWPQPVRRRFDGGHD